MALGGGIFTLQNKILPGSYIIFISAAKATSGLVERGIAALPCALKWGPIGEVFKVSRSDFIEDLPESTCKKLGFPVKSEELKGVRDMFKKAKTCYFYRLGTGGAKADSTYATALYEGERGNDIKIVIAPGDDYTEAAPIYDVSTYLDTYEVDTQTVKSSEELKDNGYVRFKKDATLALTAGTPLTDGKDVTISNADHQNALDKLEKYSFNAIGCMSKDNTIKALYAAFAQRMRDEVGMKTQAVLHRYTDADSEAVVSVENNTTTDLIYWVTGAIAGCDYNKSLTNETYNGEYEINTDYTQTELKKALLSGKFIFHQVDDDVNVLDDVNTLVTYTEDKDELFSDNKNIRVIDQIATDTAITFNKRYLGKVPNDNAGRISFWNDLVRYHEKIQTDRAIENFKSADLTVEQGESKKAIVVGDKIQITGTMKQLYMTVYCE